MSRILFSFCCLAISISIQGQSYPVNELGKIAIITYHKLGDEDTEYTRTRAGFREDMLHIINNGYHPISLSEFLSGKITAPYGKKPILITFDDSSIYQFEMEKNGSITPSSAVGIMEDLRKKKKGFTPKAVFFVTPGAKAPNNLFGQNEFRKSKLEFLVQNGYEIENHTHWHANLKKYSKLIEEQIVKTQKDVNEFLPNYKMTSLALPYGIYPPESERHRLLSGEYKGVAYKHALVFDYSNRLSFSPYSKDFNPMHVRRIHANKQGLERAFKELSKIGVSYVSDGNPEQVSIREKDLSEISPRWKKFVKILP
jgi:peptidoglycan/xylan/chitin deacetylase (PgdA/CDA1 family)